MTSHPSRSYTLKTSSARPTPCVLSTTIVWTLCVATAISRPRARAQFLILLCRRRRLSALPRRLRLRAKISLLCCDFFHFPSFPIPVLAWYFALATWVQPSHPASPRPSSVSGANVVLTHRRLSFLPLSSAVLYCTVLYCTVLYASFDGMAVGTNGLTCGLNWQCTADAIGYAVMITARLDSLPSPHSLPRFGSTPAGRQPG